MFESKYMFKKCVVQVNIERKIKIYVWMMYITGKQLMLTLPGRHDFPALVVQSWERLSVGHDQVKGFIVILLHVKHPPVQA